MLLKDKVVLVINAELPLGQAIAIDCAREQGLNLPMITGGKEA